MSQTAKYILLTLFTFIVGFGFLHSAYYKHTNNPYAQEIVLIVLGTIATILITAALINKQSELELDKEHHIKIFELKSSIYLDLINFLEKIVTKRTITEDDLIYLEYLTHKISIVANKEVLKEYSNFIDTINKAIDDKLISVAESHDISEALAKLTVNIRMDLLQSEDNPEIIKEIILKNVKKF